MDHHNFHPTSLREYDIRGIVGETLGPDDAHAIGRGFATVVRRGGGRTVAIGYDGRLSSPELAEALTEGLNASGCDVVNVGLGPTPMLYWAEATMDGVDGGVMITGSHNPPDYNGFKMVMGHAPFYGEQIAKLGTLASRGDWTQGTGTSRTVDVLDDYVDRLVKGLDARPLRVGWDAGNGAAGEAVERLVARLPGEHHTLFTDIDGHFPNHHPDPTEEKNLEDLRALVAEKGLDFGVAFDGDGDRLGAIDGQGRVIWGDQLLQIFAAQVLADEPGSTIIADVKASQALFDRVAELGGKPLMWKTGHSLIKAKMRETGSPLAGEMSGHIFFKNDYYGYDDALYAAVRLIRAASEGDRTVTEMRSAMPQFTNTPELRFDVDESRKFAVIDEVKERLAGTGARVDSTDGVRVNTDDGWWLLRASNTQNVLVARAEALDQPALDRLMAKVDEQLEASGVSRTPGGGH